MSETCSSAAAYENRNKSYWHWLEWARGNLPSSLPVEAVETLRQQPAPKAFGYDEHLSLAYLIAKSR